MEADPALKSGMGFQELWNWAVDLTPHSDGLGWSYPGSA